MTVGNAIKERIVQLCMERKIAINKLAKMSGVPQGTLNNIMQGYTKKPNVVVIYKVATALNLTLSEFYDTPTFRNEILEEI